MRLKFPQAVGSWISGDGTTHHPDPEGFCEVEEHRLTQALRVGFKIPDAWSEVELQYYNERHAHDLQLTPEHFVQNTLIPEAKQFSPAVMQAVEECACYCLLEMADVEEAVGHMASHFPDVTAVALAILVRQRLETLKVEVDKEKFRDELLAKAIAECAPTVASGKMELDYAVRDMSNHFKIDAERVKKQVELAVAAIKGQTKASETEQQSVASSSSSGPDQGTVTDASPNAPAPQGTQGSSPAAEGPEGSSRPAEAGGTETVASPTIESKEQA